MVIGEVKHFNSWVIRFIGSRGSGKSLLLALNGVHELILGKKVWSNMPIIVTQEACDWGFRNHPALWRKEHDKDYIGRKSLPLDWDAFYALSSELADGTVMIDEAQYFSDSRSSLSLKNRLLNAIVAQVRKRSLNLFYTVKQSDWVDKRLSYETDIEIDCHGMHHTEWGKENQLPQGEMVFARFYDLSGAATGHPVGKNKYFQSYKALYLKNLHLLWGCYDTSLAIDLEEGFTNVKLDLKQRVISNKEKPTDIYNSLYGVGKAFVDKGDTEVSTAKYWALAEAMGIEGSSQHLGRYLTNLGVVRKQKHGGSYVYDLTNFGKGGVEQIA